MVHIPKQKRRKCDPNSEELIFTGYLEESKGYRLINPKNGKLVKSRDVVWFENATQGEVCLDLEESSKSVVEEPFLEFEELNADVVVEEPPFILDELINEQDFQSEDEMFFSSS